jgi:hypothetical protein
VPKRYRIDFDTPSVIEENLEFRLAKDIPVVYLLAQPFANTYS